MWQPLLRVMAKQGSRVKPPRTLHSRRALVGLVGQAGDSAGGTSGMPAVPRTFEARDTLDLIDQLLWVLGPADSGEPGFVFFDLDETLITRDTCLIDGLGSTRALMARLEEKLGPSSETLHIIHSEMERDYYDAETRLVDPLLARVVRALKIQGHRVFGLTSNALDSVHSPKILETLSKYKIRFSPSEVRGELPRSGALVMDHPVCRGVIFIDNQQSVRHDKGEVIAEFVGLLLHCARRATGNGTVAVEEDLQREMVTDSGIPPKHFMRKCVLVDNTSEKCEKAAISFAQAPAAVGAMELHTLHFTEAENLVDSPAALVQLECILGRMKARGLIGADLVNDILVAPARSVGGREKSPLLQPKETGSSQRHEDRAN